MPDKILNKQMLIQPNNIIRAHYHLTLPQKQIMLMALGLLNTTIVQNADDGITFDINDMYDLSGSTMQRSKYIKRLKQSLADLQRSTLKIAITEQSRHVYSWLSDHRYNKKTDTVTVFLNPKISLMFSQLEGNYTKCLLRNIFKLNTTYAIRLYELAMHYKPTYKAMPVMTLGEFRNLLGLDNKYPKFNDLRKFVINPSIQDINAHTDITVECDPIRTGHSVTALKFHWQFQTKELEKALQAKPTQQKFTPSKARKKIMSNDQLNARFNTDFARSVS